MAEAFNQWGISAIAVFGSMTKEEREIALADFTNGNYRVITNCQLLTEGFDAPDVDCIIMGRPTQSPSLYVQTIGRGTRTFPLKKDCLSWIL